MILDDVEEHYNIRRLDNRYRVTVSRDQPTVHRSWYGYTSIYRLVGSHWEHVSGTSQSHSSEALARARAQQLYDEWEPKS